MAAELNPKALGLVAEPDPIFLKKIKLKISYEVFLKNILR
jgi:hypothetical protein